MLLLLLQSATGAYLAPLPAAAVPRLLGQVTSEEENVVLLELQAKIAEQIQRYKDIYQLTSVVSQRDSVITLFIKLLEINFHSQLTLKMSNFEIYLYPHK
jgi:hypothetical protein